MPVFCYLPIYRRENHTLPDPSLLTRVLAWTAPFAAVALKRAVQLCTSEIPIDVEDDSLSLEQAEIWTQTDDEDPQSLLGFQAFEESAPLLPTFLASTELEDDPIQSFTDAPEQDPHQEQRERAGKSTSPAGEAEERAGSQQISEGTLDLCEKPPEIQETEAPAPTSAMIGVPETPTLTQEMDLMRGIIEATGDARILSMGASFSSASAGDS